MTDAHHRDDPAPTWGQVRRALFGDAGISGLVELCRDDQSLIAAAGDRHPCLAAYCAHVGRDRLAYAPIHAQENERGRRELDRLRGEYRAIAAIWDERRPLRLALGLRRNRSLGKTDFARALRDRPL